VNETRAGSRVSSVGGVGVGEVVVVVVVVGVTVVTELGFFGLLTLPASA
jgi:hypothetical protein